MIALALALATLAPAVQSIDVVFLADSPDAPALVVTMENSGTRRALAWALVPPPLVTAEGSRSTYGGALTDQAGAPGYLTLPHAPRGGGLTERDGALSITVDDAGAWEESWQKLAASKGVAPLPVPGPRAFRLVVHGGVDGGPAPAVLYGNTLRIAGTATARADRSELRAVVKLTNGSEAKTPLLEAEATAVDRVVGCGGEVPSAATVVTTSLALKLFARGPPVCAGDLAVIPVEGSKLGPAKDVAVRGVLVRRR